MVLSADSISSLLDAYGISSEASASPVVAISPPPPPAEQFDGGGSALAIAPFPLEETFFLHSLPGALKTIYLDFTGHLTRDTPWNTAHDLPNILTPAYSTDGDFLNFSDIERLNIQNIWERVAEDFRPFHVNVTTQDPGIEALRNLAGEPMEQPPVESTDVGQTIDDSSAGVNSTLNFGGPVAAITDVNVTLDISHTFVGDLSVFLISPQGTQIELFTNVGGSGNDFLNTVLDDQAATAITDPAAIAPFSGSFRPEEPLSGLVGENPNGVWTLVVSDDVPQDSGVLNGWSLTISGGATGDTQWGQRVVIGGSDNDWFDPDTPISAGGVAHIGSFTSSLDDPAFAFAADFGSAANIAEVVSHEVGHTLGLVHDSQFRFYRNIDEDPPELVRLFSQYYGGHGTGETRWAPIMGVGYGVSLTQFSKGEYFSATNDSEGENPLQDDLQVITTKNGFGYRADDHGNTTTTATQLDLEDEDTIYFGEGIIERNTDVDTFSFTVEGVGEVVSFDISPFHNGANLDVLARLYNSSGEEIAISNPLDGIAAGGQTASFSDGGWVVTNSDYTGSVIDPGVSFGLPPGTYYLTVEGAGRPITFIDPTFHPGPFEAAGNPPDPPLPADMSDWGYSNYGSLGYYTITGIRNKGLVVGVDFDVEGGTSPLNWTLYSGGDSPGLLSNLESEAGVVTPYDLSISTTGTTISSFASENPINSADLPNHALPLDALDGYITAGGETLTFEWSNLQPWSYHQLYVFGHADFAAQNNVTITGGILNGEVQTINFSQSIEADGLVVNETQSPGGEDLTALALRVLADASGQITISVTNEFGSAAAIAGLAIAPTRPIGPPQNGSISGQKWNDDSDPDTQETSDGNGVRNSGEEGLEGWIVYLDVNNNQQLDFELISVTEQTLTVAAPNVPQPITDFPTNVVKNDLEFTQPGQILDVDVTLDITHTFDGDLNAYLISPSGTRVKLFSDIGGPGDNFTNTTFDDEAPAAITTSTPPYTGTFKPEANISASELNQYPGTLTALSAFDGEQASGIWQLEISDDANADIGALNSWSITVRLAGEETFTYLEPFTLTDADGNYSFNDLPPGSYYVREHITPQQVVDGWVQTFASPPITVTSGANVTGVNFGNWIPTIRNGSIQGQKFNDEDGDGVKGSEESGLAGWIVYMDANNNGVRDIATAPTTVHSTDVPKAISDFSTVTSPVTFDELGRVLAVEVTLDISHSYMGDLEAFLISPAGRQVELFRNVGGQFNDFDNVTLADDAERSIASLTIDDVPYTGRWRPEGFLSDFVGENVGGTWTLVLLDTEPADQGFLNSWSLAISTGEIFEQTDENGNYAFENLAPGQYIIREEQQPGWVQVPPADPNIPAAVWADSQWTVTVVGIDDLIDPIPDSQRNVKNVNFGNQTQVQLSGDYNQDGSVDAADYIVWRKTLATAVNPPFSGADGNGSGAVDMNDLDVWSANFGSSSPGGGASAATEFEAAALSVEPTAGHVVAIAPESSEEVAPSGDTALVDAIALDSPYNSHTSGRHDVTSSASVTGASNDLSDAALVAWLVSLGELEKRLDGEDASSGDSVEWGDESLESLDSLDSIFELLGSAVA